jgi:hypothetical protein
MITPTAKHAARIATVQRWLIESGWTVDTPPGFDYAPLYQRARDEFGYAHPRRATFLVAKAARLLRGDAVREAGRPRVWKPRERIDQ